MVEVRERSAGGAEEHAYEPGCVDSGRRRGVCRRLAAPPCIVIGKGICNFAVVSVAAPAGAAVAVRSPARFVSHYFFHIVIPHTTGK